MDLNILVLPCRSRRNAGPVPDACPPPEQREEEALIRPAEVFGRQEEAPRAPYQPYVGGDAEATDYDSMIAHPPSPRPLSPTYEREGAPSPEPLSCPLRIHYLEHENHSSRECPFGRELRKHAKGLCRDPHCFFEITKAGPKTLTMLLAQLAGVGEPEHSAEVEETARVPSLAAFTFSMPVGSTEGPPTPAVQQHGDFNPQGINPIFNMPPMPPMPPMPAMPAMPPNSNFVIHGAHPSNSPFTPFHPGGRWPQTSQNQEWQPEHGDFDRSRIVPFIDNEPEVEYLHFEGSGSSISDSRAGVPASKHNQKEDQDMDMDIEG